MQKIVFLIPGFRHKISQKGYKDIKKTLQKQGYLVINVPIPWAGTTIAENISHFLTTYHKKLKKIKGHKQIYLFGFSYGALIALLAATKIPVAGLILCSLSPFFKEDLPKIIPENSSSLQKKRLSAFAKLHAKKITAKIKTSSVCMLYGAWESAHLIKRSHLTFRNLSAKKKYLFTIKNTDHEIYDKKYISAVRFATSFL